MPETEMVLYAEENGDFHIVVTSRGRPVFYVGVKALSRCKAKFFVVGRTARGRYVMYAGIDELDVDGIDDIEAFSLAASIYREENDPCVLWCKRYRAKEETIRRTVAEKVRGLESRVNAGVLEKITYDDVPKELHQLLPQL